MWLTNKQKNIQSRLPRYSLAKGFSTDLVMVGPTKVKACKSVLLLYTHFIDLGSFYSSR